MKASLPRINPNRSAVVQVKLQGKIDPEWIQAYQGIAEDFDGEVTTLKGTVADQSALRGLICTLWDFNLTVLSVVLLESAGDLGT